MSPRPEDVRLKQLQHEKTERVKRGIDKLERHSGERIRMLQLCILGTCLGLWLSLWECADLLDASVI